MRSDQQTIARGFADLRRGEHVIVREAGGSACLITPAEQINQTTCATMAELANSTPVLTISHHRARAIGLKPKAEIPAVSIALPPSISHHDLGGLIGDHNHIPPLNQLSLLPEKTGSLAETALILMRLARLLPAVLVARLSLTSDAEVRKMADTHGLLVLNETAIREFEAVSARQLREVAEAPLPLADAETARIIVFRPSDGGGEHFAIRIGEGETAGAEAMPVRIHSQCITGDILASLKCDCGDQLRTAIRRMAEMGQGVLIYLAQEGRDIGLVNKLKAYALQDKGADTVDANHMLGFDADHRHFLPAAEILRKLGITSIKLMTNSPDKLAQIKACGIEVVERIPLVAPANPHNSKYLATKKTRSGHFIN
ncbi:MAG: GTP cyclohydrolase II [Proteobacteria bacterium]|nr:GTP cyclohydrolase II [Pseudomonadota bacterium]